MDNNETYTDRGTKLETEIVSNLISESDFFKDFSDDEVNMLSDWVDGYSIPAGSFIVKEGRGDNCLCILVEGAVDIYKENDPDKHLKIATVRPHDPIGEMGVIDGQPFSASVIASADSTILIITKDGFDTLINEHEKLGVRFLRKIAAIISSRLRSTTGRLADLLSNN